MADGSSITVIANPHPFTGDETVYAECRAGQTLAQMLGPNVSNTAQVTVGGYPVPRELWAHVKPKPLSLVHVVLYPQGGNGGKWARAILLIVVAIVAWYASPYLAAAYGGSAAVWAAGITIVGSMLVNALISPPTFKGLNGGGDPFNQLASITGTSNQATPYGVIPCVVGQMRFFPPHAALPYTEISGDDQYLRMLLDLGYGDLAISDIRIGETDISTYDDVEYEISTNPKLFCQDIYELSVGVSLNDAGNSATRTTQANVTEVSLDLVGPQGVFGVDSKGGSVVGTINFNVQYRATGASSWTPIASASGLTLTGGLSSAGGAAINLTSGARKTYRGGIRFKVPAGQYDVTVTRTSAKGIGFPGSVDTNSVIDGISWSVLRSISPQLPSTTGTLKLAVRIKATDQLQGVVQNLSVLAGQRIRRWDTGTNTWMAPVVTQNPAWIRLWLLTQCPAVARRLADDRVDYADTFAQWAAECDAKGYVTSFVMDSARALGDIDADVLSAGRAAFGLRNGKYAVIRDVEQGVPVQMFTPANSSGFSYSRSFLDLPHALRVNFTNPEADYQSDVVVVYADGYSADGAGGTQVATRFEQLDAKQVVDPGAAWKLGKYHLSVAYNRPTQYTWTADIEQLVCERGDLVNVAHDITGWGVAWGRVTAVNGATVTLDGPVALEAGKTYVFRIRRDDLVQVTQTINDITGNVATLAGAIAGMQPGDLFEVGEVNRGTAQLLVTKIEPSNDLSATLTGVDAAPAVWTSDTGTPPPFVSDITGKSWCAPPDPPVVTIRTGTAAPDYAGITRPVIGIGSGGGGGGIVRIGAGGGGNINRNRMQL